MLKMSSEHRLVCRNVFQRCQTFSVDYLGNPVYKQERITVGKYLPNAVNI